MNVRICSAVDQYWSDASLSRAILYAVNNGVNVINMSLSKNAKLQLTRNSIAEAYRDGIPIVATMGNNNNSTTRYPSGYHDAVITVGAIESDGNRWVDGPEDGSNYGDHIDVVAPTSILTPSKYGGYNTFTGTSSAAPFVTGLAGMIRLVDSNASPTKIEAIIRASGDEYPDWDMYYGFGLIQLDDALEFYDDNDRWIKETTLDYHSSATIVTNGWFQIGYYIYVPYEVSFQFTTNKATDGKTVIWVDPEDSDGTLFSLGTTEQMSNIGFAAAKPSTISTLSWNRIKGKLITYTYAVFPSGGGPMLYWTPCAPSEITVTFQQWGRLCPSQPTGLEGEKVGTNIELEWNRNDAVEGVSRYDLERADGEDQGDFYHYAYINDPNPGSGSTITYVDSKPKEGESCHRYRLIAENSLGWGEYCGEIWVYLGGGGGVPDSEEVEIISVPRQLSLEQNYPNPFNPTTTIRYGLPHSSRVNLRIINTRGQTVRTLVDEEKSAGWYTVTWDGKNESGQQVSSGIYLYLLETNEGSILKKMTLIR